MKPINLLEKGVGTAKKDPGKKKRKEGEEKEKIPELVSFLSTLLGPALNWSNLDLFRLL